MNEHNIEIGYIGGKKEKGIKEEEKWSFKVLEPKEVENYIKNADLQI